MPASLHFRVWDKHDQVMGQQFIKKICAEDETIFKAVAFTFGNGKIVTLAEAMELDRYVVMHSSGIHDKNKEELFDADVLEDDYQVRFEVRWDEETASFRLFASAEVKDPDPRLMTKIGNLHEHPGLVDPVSSES
jgi:hypothetical protein